MLEHDVHLLDSVSYIMVMKSYTLIIGNGRAVPVLSERLFKNLVY